MHIYNKSSIKNEQQASNSTNRITRNDLIKYMQDKYDDNFTYIDSFDGGMNKDQKYIIVSSQKLGDKEIYVLYEKKNEIETYKENYTQIKYEKETYNIIEQTISNIFNKEVIITYRILASQNNFNASTTFEDFLKSEKSGICFYVVVSPDYKIENLKNLNEKVKEEFEKIFTSCYIEIYFANTKDEFLPSDDLPYWKKEEMQKIEIDL